MIQLRPSVERSFQLATHAPHRIQRLLQLFLLFLGRRLIDRFDHLALFLHHGDAFLRYVGTVLTGLAAEQREDFRNFGAVECFIQRRGLGVLLFAGDFLVLLVELTIEFRDSIFPNINRWKNGWVFGRGRCRG